MTDMTIIIDMILKIFLKVHTKNTFEKSFNPPS